MRICLWIRRRKGRDGVKAAAVADQEVQEGNEDEEEGDDEEEANEGDDYSSEFRETDDPMISSVLM